MILKFGGTCLNTKTNLNATIKRIKKTLKKDKVIVVVSAIGREENAFSTLSLQKNIDNLSNKEKASLLSIGEVYSSLKLVNILKSKGINASYVSVYDIDLKCDDEYLNANIISVNKSKIEEYLEKNDVIVIPGFQAINSRNEICLLGKGGSDYTAIALASLLNEKEVYLFKDVEGIYTTSNNHLTSKIVIDKLSYLEALSYLYYSGEIVQIKALELAQQKSIKVLVNSLLFESKTTISEEENSWCIYAILIIDKKILLFGKTDIYTLTIIKDYLRTIKNIKYVIKPSYIELSLDEDLIYEVAIDLHKHFIEN